MPALPATSPLPKPIFIHPSSPAPPPASTSSQVPPSPQNVPKLAPNAVSESDLKPTFSLPTLRFEIRDLNHPGSTIFLTSVVTTTALSTAVLKVLSLLYQSPDSPTTTVPPTRSVTLILRSMPGVAYTTGTELDSDHKEIHFSLDYIRNSIATERRTSEILGVLTHELVHCYQYNAFGTCPGGLIEGIADWVRLNADLSPPHWKKEASGKWDAGYQHTGYFLEYLEGRFGKGTIRRMNERLRIERYEEKRFWTELVGGPVEQLWDDYAKTLSEEDGTDEDGCVLVEKDEAATPRTNVSEHGE